MNESPEIEESSGNVFAELNIPEPEQYLAKAQHLMLSKVILVGRGIDFFDKLLNHSF